MKDLTAMWFLASPLSVALGAGFSLTATNAEVGGFTQHGRGLDPMLDVVVGGRLDPHISIGGRLKLSHTGFSHSDPYAADLPEDRFSMITFDYGLAVQVQHQRMWLAPWVGFHDGWGHYKSNRYDGDHSRPTSSVSRSFSPDAIPTAGVTLGIDIEQKPNYHVTAYVDAQFSDQGTLVHGASVYVNHYTYQAYTFGVAFRL